MLRAEVLTWEAWAPQAMVASARLGAVSTETSAAPKPTRPPEVSRGQWRRMSHLGRMVACVTAALRERHATLDWMHMPVVWGSAMGEVVPSSAFLDRLFAEGPERATPLQFQNSVYNATVGHLSVAFDLRGPTEAVSCGLATGLAALARGMEWLDRSPHVLVIVGDDRANTTVTAHDAAGLSCGELVLGVLLARGVGIEVVDAALPEAIAPHRAYLPYMTQGQGTCLPHALHPASGLLLFLARGTGAVVDEDDGTALTARWCR